MRLSRSDPEAGQAHLWPEVGPGGLVTPIRSLLGLAPSGVSVILTWCAQHWRSGRCSVWLSLVGGETLTVGQVRQHPGEAETAAGGRWAHPISALSSWP